MFSLFEWSIPEQSNSRHLLYLCIRVQDEEFSAFMICWTCSPILPLGSPETGAPPSAAFGSQFGLKTMWVSLPPIACQTFFTDSVRTKLMEVIGESTSSTHFIVKDIDLKLLLSCTRTNGDWAARPSGHGFEPAGSRDWSGVPHWPTPFLLIPQWRMSSSLLSAYLAIRSILKTWV